MTNTRHTPGPWVVDEVYEDDEQRCIGIVKEGQGYIAGIHILASADTGNTEFTAEDEANAHIIAAAPAMYEALQWARQYLRMPNFHPDNSYNSEQWARDYNKLTDALAQAEGHQHG